MFEKNKGSNRTFYCLQIQITPPITTIKLDIYIYIYIFIRVLIFHHYILNHVCFLDFDQIILSFYYYALKISIIFFFLMQTQKV